jgi:hypothetical protein
MANYYSVSSQANGDIRVYYLYLLFSLKFNVDHTGLKLEAHPDPLSVLTVWQQAL